MGERCYSASDLDSFRLGEDLSSVEDDSDIESDDVVGDAKDDQLWRLVSCVEKCIDEKNSG